MSLWGIKRVIQRVVTRDISKLEIFAYLLVSRKPTDEVLYSLSNYFKTNILIGSWF